MFEAGAILFLFADTPVHAGAGRELGGVDLPLQRERRTGYPMVQGSGVKGMLRAIAKGRAANGALSSDDVEEIFGPETEKASEHAGALAVGDARVLLFPVRSLVGVFGLITCPEVLARFRRDASIVGLPISWTVPSEPAEGQACVSSQNMLVGNRLVLEEFTFNAQVNQEVTKIAQWLVGTALPQTPEYAYWRDALVKRLVVLSSDAFRDFVSFSTEVVTRIRLNPDTKTVERGALWTEEHLPSDTLLYAPLMASRSRKSNGSASGRDILRKIERLGLRHVQLGGNETVGRGILSVRLAVGGE